MRRILLTNLLGLMCVAPATAWTQEKLAPRDVEVVLPYAAGGGVDAMGRAFAREAARLTGNQWVVVNKDGASGMLGFAALAFATYLLPAAILGAPIHLYGPDEYATLQRLNFLSAASLTVLIAWLFAGRPDTNSRADETDDTAEA